MKKKGESEGGIVKSHITDTDFSHIIQQITRYLCPYFTCVIGIFDVRFMYLASHDPFFFWHHNEKNFTSPCENV
jgi:Mg2+/citrate symporter